VPAAGGPARYGSGTGRPSTSQPPGCSRSRSPGQPTTRLTTSRSDHTAGDHDQVAAAGGAQQRGPRRSAGRGQGGAHAAPLGPGIGSSRARRAARPAATSEPRARAPAPRAVLLRMAGSSPGRRCAAKAGW
jgi:hypothetical protein